MPHNTAVKASRLFFFSRRDMQSYPDCSSQFGFLLDLLNVSAHCQQFIQDLVLLVAVSVDALA